MKYYSPSTRGFYAIEVHGDKIPVDAIAITDEYHEQLIDQQSLGLEIQFDGTNVVAAPHVFTDQELKQSEVDKAKRYLKETDFYMTVDKYEQLTDEKKSELKAAREAARELIRNNTK